MSTLNSPPEALRKPLTTEQFMDLLSSKSPNELSSLRQLHVKAYPFPLYPSEDAGSYATYNFESLLPLFPGLALDRFEIEDPYHGPEVAEDGWGHDATYDNIGDYIKRSKGWKELVYSSESDEWFQETVFTTSGPGPGDEKTSVSKRDPQPETWDKLIKERDGMDSGASVEMWYKQPRDREDWKKVEGRYQMNATGDEEEKPATQIKIVARRGQGAKYTQDGERFVEEWAALKDLYRLFEEKTWEQLRESLFIKGAEEDPTAHL